MNACAWKIQNPVQQMDIWDVIYQMWFVVGLMVMTLMTSPLKLAPDAGFEEKNSGVPLVSWFPCHGDMYRSDSVFRSNFTSGCVC